MQRRPPSDGHGVRSGLSVSSVGSEAMQRRWPGGGGGQAVALSVSSVGSEAMQQRTESIWPSCPVLAFSILGRIGGDATTPYHGLPGYYISFSILGRIGGDATRPASGA